MMENDEKTVQVSLPNHNFWTPERIAKWYDKWDALLDELSKQPNEKFIKIHKYHGSKYLQIGFLEAKLDQIFRDWSKKITGVYQMANGIVVTVEVRVRIPFTGEYITRDGIAGQGWQMNQGASPIDLSQIKATGIELVPGKAYAEAFKNAVKSLGNVFGRNLNRDFKYAHAREETIKNINIDIN